MVNYPKDIAGLRQWICWRLEPDPKSEKPRKVPYDPKTGRRASSTNPDTWGTLAEAEAAMDKFMSRNIVDFLRKDRKIDFKTLGEKKTVLFIKTSPMNTALYNFINIMYTDMFRRLFEYAESKPEGRLDVPIHIICDDFACGSRILDIEN